MLPEKRGEVENILKISSPGPVLLRRGSQRDVYLTRSRDQIVLDIEKRDVKPLYWDQITSHFGGMLPPGYRAGVFPPRCDSGSIEILCGQDNCAAYVIGQSSPISVLPPTDPPPPECPNPPCTPCPQQCDDGTCPPCTPPPIPCPCQGSLSTIGSVFPNCPPNPCGAACPCPGGGCPPCDGGCACPGCESPCPNGGCPPCGSEPPICNPAGSECCMCDQGGMCMSVTVIQYGFTTQGPECPSGANSGENEGDDNVPVYGDEDAEFICTGGSCNCPCPSNDNACNRAAGPSITNLIQCKKTTRTFCNNSSDTSTYTHPNGGTIILSSDTGLLDMSGLDLGPDSLPNNDTIIEGDTGYGDIPCGTQSGGAPCFCRCCQEQDPADCGGIPVCGGCPEDAPPAPPMTSMCQNTGTSIVYRRMCASPGFDFCAVVNSGGDCQTNTANCAAVPVVIISWYPNVSVSNIEDEDGLVTGFDIELEGNPIGGPGAMGAGGCNDGHGSGTSSQSGDFDDIFPGVAGNSNTNPIWPSNNIDPNC